MIAYSLQFELTHPAWLAGLVVLPLLIYYFYKSLADFPRWQKLISLGVYPENCDGLVADVVAALGARGDEPVTSPSGRATTLHEALARD